MNCLHDLVLLIVVGLPLQGTAQKTEIPTFVVGRPTVVAFFAHASDSELEKNPDLNEALSDFQLYASQAGPKLKSAGIDFEFASTGRFRIRIGSVIHNFKAGKITVGYYFIAPGRLPQIEYGVMTDDDILATASKYFQFPIERKP